MNHEVQRNSIDACQDQRLMQKEIKKPLHQEAAVSHHALLVTYARRKL